MTTAKGTKPFAYKLKPIGRGAFSSIDVNLLPCIVFIIPQATLAGRRYHGIELRFVQDCTVERNGKTEKTATAVLHCKDPSYTAQFSAIAEQAKETVRGKPNAFDEQDGIVEFVEGFAIAFQPVRGTLDSMTQLGLWGELTMLEMLPNLERALESWTGPNRFLVDFARNKVEFEIKTSTRGHLHRIQHLQTLPSPAPGSTRAIISIHAARDPAGGETVSDLVTRLTKATKRKLLLASKLAEYGYDRNLSDTYTERWTMIASRAVAQANLPTLGSIPSAISELDYTLDAGQLAQMPRPVLSALMKKLTA